MMVRETIEVLGELLLKIWLKPILIWTDSLSNRLKQTQLMNANA